MAYFKQLPEWDPWISELPPARRRRGKNKVRHLFACLGYTALNQSMENVSRYLDMLGYCCSVHYYCSLCSKYT